MTLSGEVDKGQRRYMIFDITLVRLFSTPWTVVGYHALLQGIFPMQGIEPGSPGLQADSSPSEPPGKPNCNSYSDVNSYTSGKIYGN